MVTLVGLGELTDALRVHDPLGASPSRLFLKELQAAVRQKGECPLKDSNLEPAD